MRVKLLSYLIYLLGKVQYAFVIFIVFHNYFLSHVFKCIIYECEILIHLTFFLKVFVVSQYL